MNIQILPMDANRSKPIPTHDFGFGNLFSNRMFTQKYTPDLGWHEAVIGPYHSLELDPSTAVLHYAQEIFEGFKAYRRPDGHINLFRPWENVKRFNHSAQRMNMPIVDVETHLAAAVQLVELEHEWVPYTPNATLYIRPVMIATDSNLGVHASKNYLHYIITGPVGAYFKEGFNPVSVYISDEFRRAVIGGTGEAKTGGNYAASLIASEFAKTKGYSQVLWLDAIHGRFVEEVGSMNICFVYNGRHIVTPPLSGSILPGVTRDSILRLGADLGYQVSETPLDIHDVLRDIQNGELTEVFGCGTAAVIAPVGKFGFRSHEYIIGNGQAGAVSKHLFKELTDLQYGRIPDRFEWIYKIECPFNS